MVIDPSFADDIYLRYLSYNTAEHLKSDLVRKIPIKIDIGAPTPLRASSNCKCAATYPVLWFDACSGAVYSTPPKDRAFNGDMFFPVERELVRTVACLWHCASRHFALLAGV
jgi:hypothetical protein